MDEEFISFLIVGKTGTGKSATCNSIMGEKRFESKTRTISTTEKCQREVARVQGHNVVIVDCPGLADTDIKTDGGVERLQEEIINIFAIHQDSFDAIVITLRFDLRLTKEERRVIQELEILFETKYVKHCGILIATHADSYMPEENGNVPIEQSEQSQSPLFTELSEKCNNRVVYFDNKTKDPSIRHDQVKRLLHLVVEAKQNPQWVSPEIFRKAQQVQEEVLAKQSVIDINTETSLWLIVHDLQSIPQDSRDVELLKVIRIRVMQTHRPLFYQNKSAGGLDKVISLVFELESSVKMRIVAIEKNSDMTEAVKLISRAVEELIKVLKVYAELKIFLMKAKLPGAIAPVITGLIRAFNPRYKALRNRQGCQLQ